jgi:muramoyltetrapeptide carboxypeptidase LdcA involved in peptidoglycan recycling
MVPLKQPASLSSPQAKRRKVHRQRKMVQTAGLSSLQRSHYHKQMQPNTNATAQRRNDFKQRLQTDAKTPNEEPISAATKEMI